MYGCTQSYWAWMEIVLFWVENILAYAHGTSISYKTVVLKFSVKRDNLGGVGTGTSSCSGTGF